MPLTYAVGDVHGSLAKLETLIVQCEQHAAGRPTRFVFLGDYIDRGPRTSGVVDFLLALQARHGADVIALKGNHEAMLLAVIDGKAAARLWLVQGGAATLESYGVAAADLPARHIAWFRALRSSFDDGRRLFVHAGVDPGRSLDAQDEYDLLWIREPFLSYRRDYGRLIVHGHTPVASGEPDLRVNRLNLDTGAVYGGPLTAAVFDDTQTPPIAFLRAA